MQCARSRASSSPAGRRSFSCRTSTADITDEDQAVIDTGTRAATPLRTMRPCAQIRLGLRRPARGGGSRRGRGGTGRRRRSATISWPGTGCAQVRRGRAHPGLPALTADGVQRLRAGYRERHGASRPLALPGCRPTRRCMSSLRRTPMSTAAWSGAQAHRLERPRRRAAADRRAWDRRRHCACAPRLRSTSACTTDRARLIIANDDGICSARAMAGGLARLGACHGRPSGAGFGALHERAVHDGRGPADGVQGADDSGESSAMDLALLEDRLQLRGRNGCGRPPARRRQMSLSQDRPSSTVARPAEAGLGTPIADGGDEAWLAVAGCRTGAPARRDRVPGGVGRRVAPRSQQLS